MTHEVVIRLNVPASSEVAVSDSPIRGEVLDPETAPTREAVWDDGGALGGWLADGGEKLVGYFPPSNSSGTFHHYDSVYRNSLEDAGYSRADFDPAKWMKVTWDLKAAEDGVVSMGGGYDGDKPQELTQISGDELIELIPENRPDIVRDVTARTKRAQQVAAEWAKRHRALGGQTLIKGELNAPAPAPAELEE